MYFLYVLIFLRCFMIFLLWVLSFFHFCVVWFSCLSLSLTSFFWFFLFIIWVRRFIAILWPNSYGEPSGSVGGVTAPLHGEKVSNVVIEDRDSQDDNQVVATSCGFNNNQSHPCPQTATTTSTSSSITHPPPKLWWSRTKDHAQTFSLIYFLKLSLVICHN